MHDWLRIFWGGVGWGGVGIHNRSKDNWVNEQTTQKKFIDHTELLEQTLIPKPTVRSAVPGVSPGRGY